MASEPDDEDYDDDLSDDDDEEEGPEVGVTVEIVGLSLYTHHGVTAAEREIGQRLFLSHRTVGSHLYRIFPKLGITSRVELVAAAGTAVVDALGPWAGGGLINLLGQAGPDRVGQLWAPAERARLLAIRERFDPAGLFETNVVIG